VRRTGIATILLLLSGVGLWAAIDLTVQHLAVLTDPAYQSWCTFEDTRFDCAKVSKSTWSQLSIPPFHHPVPTALAPLGFFVGFALLILTAWLRKEDPAQPSGQTWDDTLAFAWLLLLPAAVIDLLLLYVMAVQVRTWCLVCLIIDAVTVLLLILTPMARTRGWQGLLSSGPMGALRHYNWLVFPLVFLLTVTVGQKAYGLAIHASIEGTRQEFLQWFAEQEPLKGVLRGNEPRRGNPGAPFQVVEFGDFQCPFCAEASHRIGELDKAYPGQIDFVFRQYPLGKHCNPGVARDAHPQACIAAYAAECAARAGHYWEMYDAMFELFPMLAALGAQPTLKQIGDLARRIGLPIVDFHMCLKDETVRQDVVRSVMDGRALGIQGTPTVFANGVPLPPGTGAIIYLEWLIRDHLRKQGQPLGSPVTY
jgi:protein-disulfide isomerase/uncharacterized membrane protein